MEKLCDYFATIGASLSKNIAPRNNSSNSCLVIQNFKIALITIGFIVNLLKTLVALKKAVFEKQ